MTMLWRAAHASRNDFVIPAKAGIQCLPLFPSIVDRGKAEIKMDSRLFFARSK